MKIRQDKEHIKQNWFRMSDKGIEVTIKDDKMTYISYLSRGGYNMIAIY